MTNKILVVAGAAIALAVVGCGGSGAPVTGGSGGSAGLSTFATDNLNNNYTSVWVTITKIDLVGPSGSVNIYTNTDGTVVDLRSLRDAVGNRFSFLSQKSIPVGDYVRANVQMSKDLKIVKTGASASEARQFAPAFDDPTAAGKTVVGFDFGAPRHMAMANERLVIDFDLSRWNDDGAFITPVVADGPHGGLDDPARHEHGALVGSVSGLSGTPPNVSFDVSSPSGKIAKVVTDSSTSVFNLNGDANPTIANGVNVLVKGVFDANVGGIKASSVGIMNGGPVLPPARIEGTPKNIDAVAKTFKIEPKRLVGVSIGPILISVDVDTSTVFTSDGGVTLSVDEFFAALATAEEVEVQGTFAPATNSFMARRCKIDSDNHHGGGGGGVPHDVFVSGTTSDRNAVAGTFTITATMREGFDVGVHGTFQVKIDVNTHFLGTSKEQFFATSTDATRVSVKGELQGTTLIAHGIAIGNMGHH